MKMPKEPRDVARERVGQTLNGKWRLDRLLEIGGMAAVYAATHRNGKRVAIKVLLPAFAADTDIRKRFLREGYVANKVAHSAAVSILDDDKTEDGAVFLVMELLEGQSLEAALKQAGGTLHVAHVLAVADQVLAVLMAAHPKGIVHRDIKPGNIFIQNDGHVKVLDFGLARLRDGMSSLVPTAMGVVLGTYQYMPPEQARGKTNLIDGRTDLFAMGAVMFRALTGRYAHHGSSPKEVLLAAIEEPVLSIGVTLPDLPSCVVDVVDKSLAYNMENRWPDAASMQLAVREAFAKLRPDLEAGLAARLPSPRSAPAEVTSAGATAAHFEVPRLETAAASAPQPRPHPPNTDLARSVVDAVVAVSFAGLRAGSAGAGPGAGPGAGAGPEPQPEPEAAIGPDSAATSLPPTSLPATVRKPLPPR